jgi:acyl carrier protein
MVSKELTSVILKVLALDEWDIGDDTLASEVPGWDSLNHINVILAVESHFGIRFENSELFRLKNIGDLQRMLDKKLHKGTDSLP